MKLTEDISPASLEDRIRDRERSVQNIKPDAQARIVWYDVQKKAPTPWSLVYLHGFTANHIEGYPLHLELAEHFGMNLYLSRLPAHGTRPEALETMSVNQLVSYAQEAMEIGSAIGRKVLVMGTSTGGSLALYLATQHSRIGGILLYAPLIDFHDKKARLCKYPLFKNVIGRWFKNRYIGSDYNDNNAALERIWYGDYPLNGVLELGEFVNQYIKPSLLRQISCPVFAGYYYKNRKEQDQVVSVEAIKKMMNTLATPNDLKREVAFPDAGHHVICSPLTSQSVDRVLDESKQFVEQIPGPN